MKRTIAAFLVLGMAAGGCRRGEGEDGTGGGGGSTSDGGGGAGGGSAEQTAQQIAAQTSDATMTLAQTLALADAFFQFDPDLDPMGTEDQNRQTVRSNVEAQGGACVDVTLVVGGIKADFGQGCTLANGTQVSGAVTLKLSKTDATNTLTVSATFDALVVNSFDIDGDVSFATSTGNTFAITLDLTHAGQTLAGNLDVVGEPGVMTIDGQISVSNASSQTGLVLTDVVLDQGACYPRAGAVQVTAAVSGTLTFDASTPTTGQATFALGPLSGCYQLPTYGSCASQPCSP